MQVLVALEHRAHVSDLFHGEGAQVELSERRAPCEHTAHVGDVSCVERGEVELRQMGTAFEHMTHVGDVLGVPVAEVEFCQLAASAEHTAHVGDVLGVEIIEVPYLLEVRHAGEPHAGAGNGNARRERRPDLHVPDVGTARCPSGSCLARGTVFEDDYAVVEIAVGVVIVDSKRSVFLIEDCIGLGLVTKVSGVARAAVDAGIGLVIGIGIIIICIATAPEACAAEEHLGG